MILRLLKLHEIFWYLFSVLVTEYSANIIFNHISFFWVKFHVIAQESYTILKSEIEAMFLGKDDLQ